MSPGWLLLLLALPGCSSGSHEEVVLQQLRLQEEVVEILRGIQDPAGMERAREQLRQKFAEAARVTQQARQLPEPDDEIRARIVPLVPRLQAVQRNLTAESQRIQALPGGARFLEELRQLK
jgi:Tfp pilus assembly protein PilP